MTISRQGAAAAVTNLGMGFRFVGIASGSMIFWPAVVLAQVPSPSEQPTAVAPAASTPAAAPAVEQAPTAAAETDTSPAVPSDVPGAPPSSETSPATGGEAAAPAADPDPSKAKPVVPSEVTYDGDHETAEEPVDAKPKLPELELGTRIMAGFRYEKDEDEEDAVYGFNVRQVRVSMKLKWKKRWTTRATVDFADGIDPGSGVQYLRTAFLEYKHSSALRIRVGRYKRPFSHLELQSTGDLPILNRGLLNGLIVEDSGWGDRGIGAMASGKYKPAGLGWTFSLTNPNPDNLVAQGIDAIARVTWEPLGDLLQVGVHGGNKYIDFDNGPTHFQAGGGDVTLRIAGFEWQLEGMMADLPWRNSIGYGATTLLSYTHPVTKHLKLQPVVFGEYADSNQDYAKNESVRFQGGINLVIRDRFRIMPQVRVTRAVGEALRSAPPSSPEFRAINPWGDSTQYALNLSLAL